MKQLQIKVKDGSCPVFVGGNLLAHAGPALRRLGFHTPPVVVTNTRILRWHGKALLSSLEHSFGQVNVIRIGDGERFKTQATLTRIYDGLFRARADRHSWILAFGGGIVGDIAGFAAATFMRGIPYAGVPTTLLSQVDSSVGGKVAINVRHGKNLIGAFHHPSAVLSDVKVLRTLPSRELAAGLYEVIKCGAIRSAALLNYIEKKRDAVMAGDPSALEHVVVEAIRIKADVVAADEREKRERMILNFGHTLGHALETVTRYERFRHGEAVAWGMIAAAELSSAMGMLPKEEALRLVALIRCIEKLPSLRGISAASLWRALQHDKKARDGRLRIVLLRRLGKAQIVDHVDPELLRRFVGRFVEHSS
jgi:3-dehydroquinate synthase